MFDEQFLNGSDIHGHTEMYRGAIVEPTNLLNITKKFESQLKKNNNVALVESFTEKNPNPSHRTVTEVKTEP